MSFFDIALDVAPSLEGLRDIRQKVSAIRTPIFEEVRGPIRDEIAKDVDRIIAPAPQPAVHEFDFSTPESRAWYFWAKRTGQIPGQDWDPVDGTWARQQILETSWQVSVNVSANEAFMTIGNDAQDYKGDNYAQAVYGPDAVPGHANTGWGEEMDAEVDKVIDHLDEMLYDALDRALAGYNA